MNQFIFFGGIVDSGHAESIDAHDAIPAESSPIELPPSPPPKPQTNPALALSAGNPFARLLDPTQPIHCGFTIVVDSREQSPFAFTDICADADRDNRELLVPTTWKGLATGDYSIEGLEGYIAIERKSREDLYGTIVSTEDRRERFVAELERMTSMHWNAEATGNPQPFTAVIVEETFGACLRNPPDYGRMKPEHKSKTLARSVLAFQQRFPLVQWCFADDRRLAEVVAYRWMERFWRKWNEAGK